MGLALAPFSFLSKFNSTFFCREQAYSLFINHLFINTEPTLEMIKSAIYSYASQAGKIAQSVSLAGYTLVINETSILESLVINGMPYEPTTPIQTTHFSHKPLASSAISIYNNTLGNSIEIYEGFI